MSTDWARDDVRQQRGRALGLVYLLFLLGPVIDLFDDHSLAYRLTGGLGIALFIGAYVRLFFVRGMFRRAPETLRQARLCVAVMLTLMVVLPLALGSEYVGLVIFTSVAAALVVPDRVVIPAIVVIAGVNAGVMVAAHVDGGTIFSLLLVSLLSPLTVLAMRRLIVLTKELAEAREENARLAVTEERLRFSRDLHDLLGHSLSLIVLKSELAGRLVGRDDERAGGEVRDIESVARQALVEVREAVSGYRRSLDEELTGARTALQAAGLAVELPERGAPLPAPVESLLAWAVREGTTNVLRHSHAGRVVVSLASDGEQATLAVEDDGVGAPAEAATGNGLRGLAERMTAAGGTLGSGPRTGGDGFRLVVTVPMDAPSYAAAPRPPEVSTSRTAR